VDEVDEMLETGVKMGLSSKPDNLLEVGVVDMGVNAEKAFEYRLDNLLEILGKRCAKLEWENAFIVKLSLNPRHQVVYVLWCIAFNRLLNLYTISPQIFIVGTGVHDGTVFGCAVVGYGPVQEADFVEKINRVHGKPFVEVLSLREHYRAAHISTTESSLCIVRKFLAFFFLMGLNGLEGFVLS